MAFFASGVFFFFFGFFQISFEMCFYSIPGGRKMMDIIIDCKNEKKTIRFMNSRTALLDEKCNIQT